MAGSRSKFYFVLLGALTGLAGGQKALAEPEAVMSGAGKVKFNGLLQAWYLNDTGSAMDSNFRVRRSELRFSGSVVDRTRWMLMVDPAKSLRTGAIASTNDNKVLQDVIVAFEPVTGLEMLLGQFKTQTTAEGLEPSSALLMPERSLVARTYGDRREPGFMAVYTNKDSVPLSLSTMVSNGQGANVDDGNVKKDFSARFEASPAQSLTVGMFTLLGDFKYAQKGRVGANVKLAPGASLLKLEYVEAKDSGFRNRGVVAEAAYTFDEKLQPAVRYEILKAAQASERPFVAREASVGFNYFVLNHNAKVQAAYTMILDNVLGSGGAPSASLRGSGTLLTLSFQAAI